MEVPLEVWSCYYKARSRNGTPVLDCCWIGSECYETVLTPSEVNSICLRDSGTDEKWYYFPWSSTRLPDVIRPERSIRGVACPCLASWSSWPILSSDDTLDIKINTGVQLIWRCACFKKDDDTIEANKFGLVCFDLNWKVNYHSVSVQSNWAWITFCTVLSVVR